jgi:phage I-like protein
MAAIDLPTGAEVPDWVHLLPAGNVIRTYDGRGPYRFDDAEALIAASLADQRGMLIDENHSTDIKGNNGEGSPARGWIKELQARADGIWGRVKWNPSGKALLEDGAYRGISPVFLHTQDGVVKQILRAALTNTPNLRDLTALNTEQPMNWSKIAKALGMAEDADEAAIMAKITAMMDKKADPAMAAMQSQMSEIGTALGLQAATGTAIVEAVKALQASQANNATQAARITVLESAQKRSAADAFMAAQIAAKRGIPADKREGLIALHMQDAAQAEAVAKLYPDLGPTGLGGNPPPTTDETLTALNAEQQGVELANRARTYMAKQHAAGITIDYSAAVIAVSEGKK